MVSTGIITRILELSTHMATRSFRFEICRFVRMQKPYGSYGRGHSFALSPQRCRWRSLTFTSANRLGYLPMAFLKFHQRWRWNIPSWRLHGWCTVHSSPDRCGWMVTHTFLVFLWIYDGNFVFSCIMSTCERLSPLCRVLSFCIFNQFVLLSNLGHCPPWRQPNLPNSWGLKLALLWQRWIWHDSSDF